jgi:predicted metal-dependent HD superfamily phosphohydrolase
MNYRILLEKVQNHVEQLFKTPDASNLLYHNLTHTQKVVEAATQIANHYALDDHDFFIVVTAAWFHDVGYLHATAGHEEIGADEAAALLTRLDVSDNIIEKIKHCILATKLPQHPTNLLEEIICDADLFHFGTDDFSDNNKRMRKEANFLYRKDFTKEEWRNKTIELLKAHHYFTEYCRSILNAKKQENMEQLLNQQYKAALKSNNEEQVKPDVTGITENNKSKNEKRPDRGIETMFRVASSNHQKLSDMADNKSHILITVNSIIISVIVSLLLRKLDENNNLIIPAIILLLVSLVTIVLSILATRPNISNGTFTQQELSNKTTNLLFFGNFFKMSLDSYKEGMLQMMGDRDFLYGSLIKDIYAQGVVLGRKYKLLRAAYNIFMFGLIISVVAFIIAAVIDN